MLLLQIQHIDYALAHLALSVIMAIAESLVLVFVWERAFARAYVITECLFARALLRWLRVCACPRLSYVPYIKNTVCQFWERMESIRTLDLEISSRSDS